MLGSRRVARILSPSESAPRRWAGESSDSDVIAICWILRRRAKKKVTAKVELQVGGRGELPDASMLLSVSSLPVQTLPRRTTVGAVLGNAELASSPKKHQKLQSRMVVPPNEPRSSGLVLCIPVFKKCGKSPPFQARVKRPPHRTLLRPRSQRNNNHVLVPPKKAESVDDQLAARIPAGVATMASRKARERSPPKFLLSLYLLLLCLPRTLLRLCSSL
jgi:hypothetical protein